MKNQFKKLLTTHYSLLTKNESGFTLIEMLMIIMVMGILFGILAGVSRSSEEQYALQRSAQITTQAIDIAISNSLAGKKHPDSSGTPSPGGYGIRFVNDADNIHIFADCNKSETYSTTGTLVASCEAAGASSGSLFPESVEQLKLEPNVTITRIQRCAGQGGPYAVVFIPPDPVAEFNPGGNDFNAGCREHYVELSHANGGSVKVYINQLGLTRIE